MKSDLKSVLGEELLIGNHSSIYRNGIAKKENYILWGDIDRIYVGGTTHTINGIIPNGENMTLHIVDTHNNDIGFSLSGFFRMKKESKQQFSDIYTFILDNITKRQFQEFISKIRNGETVSFKKFEVTREAFYFHKAFGGYDKKDINYIKGCGMAEGEFYIQYQEPNKKVKVKRIGSIIDIPNIHIARLYISAIAEQALKI
jgi:hypothetical protein